MVITEKKHRLPKEFYRGEISVAVTLCLKGNAAAGFNLCDSVLVNTFSDILSSVVTKTDCIVPVYCFMPDHQHLIITGTSRDSDILKSIIRYKQKTGFWMSANKPEISWQKDFYDHVIKTNEDIAAQVRYILDNPVRKGLVLSWQEYPFKGAIGCKIEDVLDGIITL
ncbi:MAG: transposase [Nitrospirae bacterium]|nr:transposase [Nitrospirota bacterium]